MSNSLRPHGLQHTQLPGRSSSPGVCWNSCPLSQWCLPIISSSVAPFASCPQSFPASGSLATSYWRSAWGASHPWVSGMLSLIRWHVLVGQGSGQTHSPSGSCWITSFSCSESWARCVCGPHVWWRAPAPSADHLCPWGQRWQGVRGPACSCCPLCMPGSSSRLVVLSSTETSSPQQSRRPTASKEFLSSSHYWIRGEPHRKSRVVVLTLCLLVWQSPRDTASLWQFPGENLVFLVVYGSVSCFSEFSNSLLSRLLSVLSFMSRVNCNAEHGDFFIYLRRRSWRQGIS